MQYTILGFTCPYICFGTPCAILRGVVDDNPEDGTISAETYVGTRKR
jgi:hypothetical protein